VAFTYINAFWGCLNLEILKSCSDFFVEAAGIGIFAGEVPLVSRIVLFVDPAGAGAAVLI
jgi:hypothetical protein